MTEKELISCLRELQELASEKGRPDIAKAAEQAIRGEYPLEEETVISPVKEEGQSFEKKPVSDEATASRERVFKPTSWGGRRSRGDLQRSVRRYDPEAEEKRLQRALKRAPSKEEKLFESLKEDKAA